MLDVNFLREDARASSTESLLDRATVYRTEMDPLAVHIIENELCFRGLDHSQIAAHAAERERDGLRRRRDGTVVRCNYCSRPATEHAWKWHRLWGWFLPLWPRWFHFCREHFDEPPVDIYGRTLHY